MPSGLIYTALTQALICDPHELLRYNLGFHQSVKVQHFSSLHKKVNVITMAEIKRIMVIIRETRQTCDTHACALCFASYLRDAACIVDVITVPCSYMVYDSG